MALFKLIAVVLTAAVFLYAGFLMLEIESEAGNTVAEAFYNAMGVFSLAMAGLTIVAAIPSPTATSSRPETSGGPPASE
jgi:hypothetical protein